MLITNGKLITWEEPNQILEGQAILIHEDTIGQIGLQKDLIEQNPSVESLDAEGKYVLPGNICAHTHFYGAFSRGMNIYGEPPADFPDILRKLWWPLDRALTLEDVRYSALVCLVDAIKHGTTTLIDHHASPNAIAGSLDEIADAIDQSGLRASLCYEVSDRGGKKEALSGIEENLRFLQRINRENPAGGRIRASFGLHASLTLSNQTLNLCREKAPENTGFHIHVAEHIADQYDSLEKSKERVVDRLCHHRILGPKTIVAHAVHIDAREMQLLAETGTWVTHQPRSNMNNAVGVADVESMMRCGIPVCLGNDGFSNAMWEEWKTAYLVHKLWHKDPRRMPADRIIEMAIYNNSKLASKVFDEQPLGMLKPGALADLIFVDYHPYTPLTTENLPWHIIFGFHESMVTTTICSGKVLMHKREIKTLDEEEISHYARKLAPEIWNRYVKQF